MSARKPPGRAKADTALDNVAVTQPTQDVDAVEDFPSFNETVSRFSLSTEKYTIAVGDVTVTGVARPTTEAGVVAYTKSVRKRAKVFSSIVFVFFFIFILILMFRAKIWRAGSSRPAL